MVLKYVVFLQNLFFNSVNIVCFSYENIRMYLPEIRLPRTRDKRFNNPLNLVYALKSSKRSNQGLKHISLPKRDVEIVCLLFILVRTMQTFKTSNYSQINMADDNLSKTKLISSMIRG